jgi:hypothetical protein
VNNTELLEIIKKLLKMDADLDFLLNAPENDPKTQVAPRRERFNQLGKQSI